MCGCSHGKTNDTNNMVNACLPHHTYWVEIHVVMRAKITLKLEEFG